MLAELSNTIATIIGIIVALSGAFLFAFWVAMGIWTFNDIRNRTRDWLAIVLATLLVLIFPLVGWILFIMIRPKDSLADAFDRALEEETLLRELEGTLACHSCGAPVQDRWNFCVACHTQLRHACPKCGKAMRQEWDICVSCGANQLESDPAPQRERERAREFSELARPESAATQPRFLAETPVATEARFLVEDAEQGAASDSAQNR